MCPCRTDLRSPISGCRLVRTMSLGRRVVESRWALRGPSSLRRLIQGKAEGNYLILLVMMQIYWTGDLDVSSLRASWRASACWARWGEKGNLVNPPWYVLGIQWLYCQPDFRWRKILSGAPHVTSYVGIEYYQERKGFSFHQFRSWSIS